MNDGKFDASLSAQAASLKKTMQNRVRRRNSDRDRPANEVGTEQRRLRKRSAVNATGGLTLGSGGDFVPAVASLLRCSLCQISLKNVAEEQQHLAGPIHRKAVARQQADHEQSARVSKGRSAAQSAVAAAQWHAPAVPRNMPNSSVDIARQVSTGLRAMPAFPDVTHQLPQQPQHDKQLHQHVHDKQKPQHMHDKQHPQQQYQQQQQQHKAKGPAAAAAAPVSTHADVLAQLRKDDEPLTVGGWVPPSLSNLQPFTREMCNKEAQADPQDTEAQTATASNPEATLERLGEPSTQHGLSGLLFYGSYSDESADSGSSSPSPQDHLGPFF